MRLFGHHDLFVDQYDAAQPDMELSTHGNTSCLVKVSSGSKADYRPCLLPVQADIPPN